LQDHGHGTACPKQFITVHCSPSSNTLDRLTFLLESVSCLVIHCVFKKVPTFKSFVTLSNLNRFSKLLHRWKMYKICYKADTTLPTSSQALMFFFDRTEYITAGKTGYRPSLDSCKKFPFPLERSGHHLDL